MTTERVAGRTAPQVLAWSRAVLDAPLRAAVASLPGPVGQVAGYHLGWYDERGRPSAAPPGKALRPALVLLAAQAAAERVPDGAAGGRDAAVANALPAAVAVELVHNFSLLHDDVMDGDLTRRHRPTAWAVFGSGPAILAGDALVTLAFALLGGPAAALRTLSGAVQELVAGQLADVMFERRDDVTSAECLRMAEGKTAALLGASCALGALRAGAAPDRVEALRAFGSRLGLAFQIVDDLLGIWGDPAITGKPAHSDLRNRKKSLPVVAALSAGTPAAAELAELYGSARELSATELARAAELVELAGGRSWSQAKADLLMSEAVDAPWSADPEPQAGAELVELAHLTTSRTY